MSTLSDYLLKRELVLKPSHVDADDILDEDTLLTSVSDVWISHREIITKVIQQRVNAIAKHLVNEAIPEEVIVLRQSLVELSAILDDFQRYADEKERRTKKEGVQQSSL